MQNLLTSMIMILEVLNKHHCKLDKILRNCCFEHNVCFSVSFEYDTSICIVPWLIHKQRIHSFLTLLYIAEFREKPQWNFIHHPFHVLKIVALKFHYGGCWKPTVATSLQEKKIIPAPPPSIYIQENLTFIIFLYDFFCHEPTQSKIPIMLKCDNLVDVILMSESYHNEVCMLKYFQILLWI